MSVAPSTSLRRNGFGPLFLDRSINFFVNEAFNFAIPAALFIVTGEPAWSALVFGLEWVSRLVFLFLGGTIVDRFGAVSAARAAWLVRTGTGLLGLLGVLLGRDSDLATALVLAACGVISAGFFEINFVANERLAAEVVDRGSRAEIVQSRLGAVDQAALIGGPALGGAILLLGVPALLGIYAVAMAVGTATMNLSADPAADAPGGSARSASSEGSASTASSAGAGTSRASAVRNSYQAVRTVIAHPLLRVTMLTAMAANFVLAVILSTLASVVGLVYGHDPRAASLITSAAGGISLLTILLTPMATRAFGYARCLWTMTAATAAAAALATLMPGIALFAVVLTVAYIGDSVIAMVARSVRIRIIPRDRYSSLMSATVFLNYLPMPFAGLLIGGLVTEFGLRATWITIALISLALGVAAWCSARVLPARHPELAGVLEIFYEKATR